jgi:hypothetical protein
MEHLRSREIVHPLLQDILSCGGFCASHAIVERPTGMTGPQKPLALAFDLTVRAAIGDIEKADCAVIWVYQRSKCLSYLLDVRAIKTTEDTHTFPPKQAGARLL